MERFFHNTALALKNFFAALYAIFHGALVALLFVIQFTMQEAQVSTRFAASSQNLSTAAKLAGLALWAERFRFGTCAYQLTRAVALFNHPAAFSWILFRAGRPAGHTRFIYST